MLQGYDDTVLRAEVLDNELRKALLQSKLDGAFAKYHKEELVMQAKSDDLIRKNRSLR
jgi:hypothetical protein